ncbi:MAG: UDP-galactopyranose mutase [Clostridia bacterium]|nr:UDP-galactopyranose mutase [Clostridia bacterium]
MYDVLIVGAGLFGCTMADLLKKSGRKVLVIDKRSHIGGNCYTEEINGITVHKYGAHIVHTSDSRVWKYLNTFTEFNRFTHAPVAVYHGKPYNLPFNMNTFSRLYGVTTPSQAEECIQADIVPCAEPKNLEEKALSLVGRRIYEKLIKEYTEKQWGVDCRELPPEIITRLPLRMTYDNDYFNDEYEGIPKYGYTEIFQKMLYGCHVMLETPFTEELANQAKLIVYSGSIDEYFGYCYGALDYRSLRFETVEFLEKNVQGAAVVNYTDADLGFTRTIEHKHFDRHCEAETSILTYEYPASYDAFKDIPYYPINNERNNAIYAKYKALAESCKNVFFGGRLGSYRYLDMDDTIMDAFELFERIEAEWMKKEE